MLSVLRASTSLTTLEVIRKQAVLQRRSVTCACTTGSGGEEELSQILGSGVPLRQLRVAGIARDVCACLADNLFSQAFRSLATATSLQVSAHASHTCAYIQTPAIYLDILDRFFANLTFHSSLVAVDLDGLHVFVLHSCAQLILTTAMDFEVIELYTQMNGHGRPPSLRIYNVVARNTVLRSLLSMHCHMQAPLATKIATAMLSNKSLTRLDLSGTMRRVAGMRRGARMSAEDIAACDAFERVFKSNFRIEIFSHCTFGCLCVSKCNRAFV
jgi:hypothetical protein